MERFVGGHFEPAFPELEDAGERGNQHQQQHFEQHPAPVSLSDSNKANYFNTNGIHPNLNCDIKPRLTKEQHDILEAEYQKQHKPPTSTKKGFAESLGVSLDKVNNWFQNRRAKAKQDAKKALGAQNLYLQQQQQQQQAAQSMTYSSSAEPSPAFTTSEYYNMMQQCTADDSMTDGLLSMQQTPLQQQFPDQSQFQQNPFQDATGGAEQYRNFPLPSQMSHDVYESPNEMNRRTLTQEQFDAFGGMMENPNSLDMYSDAFQGNQDVLSQIFPNYQTQQPKQSLDFPNGLPMSMPTYEASIPSSGSERSTSFPSSSSVHDQATYSAPPSDWSDSRSSSAASGHFDAVPGQVLPNQHAPAATTSVWQPGQSKPVDLNDLKKEFTQANLARQYPQQMQPSEQPLAFPSDEAFLRHESQNPNSLLAQSMGNVGIHTPQPQQHSTFKSPLPPSNIASRRQRPGPLALSSGAMRSQSYSGAIQPLSPGHIQAGQMTPGQQSLRRIKSSINGGVAAGRVQKSQPGSAQRSPLHFSTFAEAMNSPKAMRHASLQSNDSLAPPTPLSPSEFSRQELQLPGTAYANSGQVSRQPSISETDAEHGLPFPPSTSTLPQNVSSPPHTPMFYQQNFVQQRVGNNVITENTPPQSAPASQQCFPSTTFTAPPTTHALMQQQAFAQQQHLMNVVVPEQHFRSPNIIYTKQRPQTAGGLMMARAPTSQHMTNSDAHAMMAQQMQLQMQMQMLQQALPQGQPQSLPPSQQQHVSQEMRTAPQASYQNMFSAAPSVPSMQVTAQVPKQAPQPPSEFFVHEYNPPESVKRAATPRKNPSGTVVEQKQYTFAHATPAHYAEKHRKASSLDGKTSSTSPASSSGAGSI